MVVGETYRQVHRAKPPWQERSFLRRHNRVSIDQRADRSRWYGGRADGPWHGRACRFTGQPVRRLGESAQSAQPAQLAQPAQTSIMQVMAESGSDDDGPIPWAGFPAWRTGSAHAIDPGLPGWNLRTAWAGRLGRLGQFPRRRSASETETPMPTRRSAMPRSFRTVGCASGSASWARLTRRLSIRRCPLHSGR